MYNENINLVISKTLIKGEWRYQRPYYIYADCVFYPCIVYWTNV